MHRPYHIVFTTINIPHILDDLYHNFTKYNRLNQVKVWVVGDLKSPQETKSYCDEINNRGLVTIYLDVDSQRDIENKYPKFYSRIPFNNETRRNFGYLSALEDGCEILISMDDDNFPIHEDDFIGQHLSTGRKWTDKVISEDSGFHNICEYLDFNTERVVHPRGFPFSKRGSRNNHTHNEKGDIIIGVTAGLWLKDPDIDATTWLNGAVEGVGYKGQDTHVLSQDTWTPVNTQNTSVVSDLIPAYLCVPMGWDLPGGKINRYGDIWGGYFLQSLIRGTDYHVSFGRPLVEHRRNPHNYIDDLRHEYWGMVLTDWLLERLKDGFQPKEKEMTQRVLELANFIDEETEKNFPKWSPKEISDFMSHTSENLRLWSDACEEAIRIKKAKGKI